MSLSLQSSAPICTTSSRVRRTGRVLFGALLLSVVAGCASLNKSDCLEGNWEAIGYADGQRGFEQSRVNTHAKSCAKHDVTPNAAAYAQGFAVGLSEYCVPLTGYRQGRAGVEYPYHCPNDVEPAFVGAYQDGLEELLQSLHWRYQLLEHRYDIKKFRLARRPTQTDESSYHSPSYWRDLRDDLGAIKNTLDNLKHERLRVRALLYRAEAYGS